LKPTVLIFQFPNGDAERTPVSARRRRRRVLRVRAVLYSGQIEGFSERNLRKSKLEKLYAKRRNLRYLSSNFRAATLKEPLPMPVVVVAVSSVAVSSSTVGQLKEKVSAIVENQSKRNYTPTSTSYLPISEQRRRENVCRCPLSPWACPPCPYRALQWVN
jgi:hypothetical protein